MFPSRGGGNSRGHIFRAVFLSSSRPPSAHRLIRPTARRSIRTSGQANSRKKARRKGKQAVGSRSRFRPCIPVPRIVLTLVSPLVSADGAKGVSLPSTGSVGGPVFPRPRSAARHGLCSAPPLVSPPRGPSSERRASKQDGGLVSSARLGPVPLLVSAPWLALNPAVNRRKWKAKRPAPLVEERGEKRRFNRKASL